MSAATYRKAVAHAERPRQAWHDYDLATENCNAVVFEFADRLGLEVPHDMLELPAAVVRQLAASVHSAP